MGSILEGIHGDLLSGCPSLQQQDRLSSTICNASGVLGAQPTLCGHLPSLVRASDSTRCRRAKPESL